MSRLPSFKVHVGLPTSLSSGETIRLQAWVIRRLISIFSRHAKRGHFPRERGVQKIYQAAGIALPADPRIPAR